MEVEGNLAARYAINVNYAISDRKRHRYRSLQEKSVIFPALQTRLSLKKLASSGFAQL